MFKEHVRADCMVPTPISALDVEAVEPEAAGMYKRCLEAAEDSGGMQQHQYRGLFDKFTKISAAYYVMLKYFHDNMCRHTYKNTRLSAGAVSRAKNHT